MGASQSLGDDAEKLYDAARKGDTAEVARLAQLGTGLEWRDAKRRTPLLAAVALNKHAVVKQLLELGAEPHAVGATREVGSALHLAASCGDRGSVELLLASRASPFLTHHGATPLDAAASAGDVALCRRFESLGLFAAHVYEKQAPGLVDAALGRERWERRYVTVVPRYSAAPAPAQGVLCALQLRVSRRDSDAAPCEAHLVHSACAVPAASGAVVMVNVVDSASLSPPGQRSVFLSCTPPGVFPPEGGSVAAATARMNALLAACTNRAPPRVPQPAAQARRSSAAGAAVAQVPPASLFPTPPSSGPMRTDAAEPAPAVTLNWLGSQPAPRTTTSGAPETERTWPSALQMRIAMPLVSRASEFTVAVVGQELTLYAPGKYRLRAILPFPVVSDLIAGFDPERRELNLNLTVLCIPRDPPPPQAAPPSAQPAAHQPAAHQPAAPPPLPTRPVRAAAAETDADLEEAIRRSLADVAVQPPQPAPPAPSVHVPPSAPPMPSAPAAAQPAAPSAPAAAAVVEEEDDGKLCIICMTDPRTVGILHGDSMHVVACAGCAPRLQNGSACPICRRPVERLVHNIYS